MSEAIELRAFTIERTTIKTTREEFDAAERDDDIANHYDAHLSDMDGETLMTTPGGSVINPYGEEVDLLNLLEPMLDLIPTWRVEQYVAGRRTDEE